MRHLRLGDLKQQKLTIGKRNVFCYMLPSSVQIHKTKTIQVERKKQKLTIEKWKYSNVELTRYRME